MLWAVTAAVCLGMACSDKPVAVDITQYTDTTDVNGIALYKDEIMCATNGGLLSWKTDPAQYAVYRTDNGLISNVAIDVIVDGKGMLWVGTKQGISRFNGTDWRSYDDRHGLPSVEITDLAIDRNGRLWVGTTAGVAEWNGGSFAFVDDPDGPGETSVNSLFFDFSNNLWVSAGDRMLFRTDDGWHVTGSSSGFSFNNVTAITQSYDRKIWAASKVGVITWSGSNWRYFPALDETGTFEVRYLHATEEEMWFFTANGLHASIGSEIWRHITKEDDLLSNNLISGFMASADTIYAGSVDGLSIVEEDEITNLFVPDSPNGFNFTAVSIDDSGHVWLGGWETELNYYDGSLWTYPSQVDPRLPETVRSIVYGPDGTIVFNTINGIVFKRGNDVSRFNRLRGLTSDDVRCGMFDSEGHYWAGTAAGISTYQNGSWRRIREAHGLPSGDVWACAAGPDGTLWFGTADGIVSIAGDVLTDHSSEIDLDNKDIRAIHVVGDTVYFGTAAGKLITYDGTDWDVIGSRYLKTGSSILSIDSEADGTLWIGTNGHGLVRYGGDGVSRITVSDGLPSNIIRSVACGDDAVWVACYGGAAEVSYAAATGE